MIRQTSRNELRLRIHRRIRKRLQGAPARPRLSVFRSLKHIYAQVIDDHNGRTLAAASSAEKGAAAARNGGNLAGAKEIGKLIAGRAQQAGIKKVVFDRSGYLYHGRIKALAEAAREAGLEF
jgi:large subunit ribosomal protein L18